MSHAPYIRTLPPGPLDIVGDIHGEIDGLLALLQQLGYDAEARHPEGRHLVFVGDFCDRGPDSPGVMTLAARWVASGRASAVIGNHEVNLIRADIKDGSGWFFDERVARDTPKYAPFQRVAPEQRQALLAFAEALPAILERDDLRIVHAAWHSPAIAAVRALPPGSLRRQYDTWEALAYEHAERTGLDQRMAAEREQWGHDLDDPEHTPPRLPAHAEHEANKQSMNPLKVLTSGLERGGSRPFYAGGKWRFVERVPWWETYRDDVPVIMGHYWRRAATPDPALVARGYLDIFRGAAPDQWLGPRHNVFCIDFSAGGRWVERRAGDPVGATFKLAAMRWPEAEVVFDDGTRLPTHPGTAAAKMPR